MKAKVLHIAFGQLLSLLIACTGIASKTLELRNASVPAFQSFFSYFFLAAIFTLYRYWNKMSTSSRCGGVHEATVEMWIYAVIAIMDVQANFLVLTAFRYANFATVAILLHMTVPIVTFLNCVILEKRFATCHYVGSAIAFLGCIIIFVSHFDSDYNSSEEVKGDLMVILCAFLYSCCNIGEEFCVSSGGNQAGNNYLCFMGSFAAFFTAIQLRTLEWDAFHSIVWSPMVYVGFAGYTLSIFLFYALGSVFFRIADSLLFNISLLTADVFTMIASYVFFNEPVSKYYYIALVLNGIGIYIYSLQDPEESKEIKSVRKGSLLKYSISEILEYQTPESINQSSINITK